MEHRKNTLFRATYPTKHYINKYNLKSYENEKGLTINKKKTKLYEYISGSNLYLINNIPATF